MTELLVCVLAAPGENPDSSHAALVKAGVRGAVTIELERPGAWAAARNEALERAESFGFLGLIEAGVEVSPGWLEGWRAVRSEAAGAYGGPVTASGRVAAGLDPVRHGQVLGLPGDGALASGNAILNTAALRAVGGFSPVRGHRAAIDGLADWQLAIEAIEQAGWECVLDDRLAATRDVTAASYGQILRRRLHTGARSAALAPEPESGSLASAVRSTAAASGQLVRGDLAASADRFAWTAAQTGAALGPLLAHRGLQPDRARTPWRPSVAPAQPGPVRGRVARPARTQRGARTVLLYHRVCDLADDPMAVSVTPEHFAEQMDWLAQSGRAASLADVAAGKAPRGAVAVTFDDGYHDNLVHALPVLGRTAVPATLFAATGQIERGEGFWWDTIGRLLASGIANGRPGPLTIELPEGARSWHPGRDTPVGALLDQVHAALRPRDHASIAAALVQVADWAGEPAGPTPESDRPLTVPELRELAASGTVDVQSHGCDHLSLALVPADVRARDIVNAADAIEEWLGTRPRHIAYPFGVPGTDVDDATRDAAALAGYEIGVINAPGPVETANPLAIPRRAVPDVDGAQFAEWLG